MRAAGPAGRGPPGCAGAATGTPPLVRPARRRWARAGTRPDRPRNGASRSRLAEPGDGRLIPGRPAAVSAGVLVQVERGLDERHMAEGLRRVADLPRVPRVILLAEQADIIAQREQPVEELMRLLAPADHV